jgi:hypothetical protein
LLISVASKTREATCWVSGCIANQDYFPPLTYISVHIVADSSSKVRADHHRHSNKSIVSLHPCVSPAAVMTVNAGKLNPRRFTTKSPAMLSAGSHEVPPQVEGNALLPRVMPYITS